MIIEIGIQIPNVLTVGAASSGMIRCAIVLCCSVIIYTLSVASTELLLDVWPVFVSGKKENIFIVFNWQIPRDCVYDV